MICTDLICADKVLFDMISGKISLIGYLESYMTLSKVPTKMSFMVASTYKKNRVDENANIEIGILINSEKINSYKIDLNFQSHDLPAKSILNVRAFEINEPGMLEIISIDKNNNDKILFSKKIELSMEKIS